MQISAPIGRPRRARLAVGDEGQPSVGPAKDMERRPLTAGHGDGALDIVFVGALPPPVNGLSNANAATIRALTDAGQRVATFDLSPRSGGGRLKHHLSRVGAVLRALAALGGPSRAPLAYMPVDGGLGLIYGILFALLFRLQGAAIAAHHHSFAYIDRSSALVRLYLRLGPARQIHVFLCDEMRSAFERRYRPDLPRLYEGLVLPNAFMMRDAAGPPDEGPANAGLVIGHLSNLSVEKGTDLFLDLFEALGAAGVQVRARLAGPVEDAALLARIRAIGAHNPDRFEYLGPVYGPEKTAFFDSLEIFVFPTRYRNEAQPLVLLEALARACVLLAIPRGCIACDHAESGGLLASGPDTFVTEAAAWVEDLAAAPARLQALRARARAHFDQQFSQAMAAKSRWLAVVGGVYKGGDAYSR